MTVHNFLPIHKFLKSAEMHILRPADYTPEFCAQQAVFEIIEAIDELRAIFAEEPHAVMKLYEQIDAEGMELGTLFNEMKQRKVFNA